MVTFHLRDKHGAERNVGSWKVVLNEGVQHVAVKVSGGLGGGLGFFPALDQGIGIQEIRWTQEHGLWS